MATEKMHADEVDIDVLLVRRLIAAQFPRWADLPLERVASAGTDNAIYRLGADKAVRLPRIPGAVGQVEKEQQWLPLLAPHVPLAMPVPLGSGVPGEGYPWPWSVYPWIAGHDATAEAFTDVGQAVNDLAEFITALHRIDATDGPAPGQHNFNRGVPLARRDAAVREAIAALGEAIDGKAVTATWEAALSAPVWSGAPVWIHGDLSSGNLLVEQGQLCGVIDFGGLAVGDPACDLLVAWEIFAREAREKFRVALSIDDAMWERGRGWALSVALIALPYYQDTNPLIAARARHVISQVLVDRQSA